MYRSMAFPSISNGISRTTNCSPVRNKGAYQRQQRSATNGKSQSRQRVQWEGGASKAARQGLTQVQEGRHLHGSTRPPFFAARPEKLSHVGNPYFFSPRVKFRLQATFFPHLSEDNAGSPSQKSRMPISEYKCSFKKNL